MFKLTNISIDKIFPNVNIKDSLSKNRYNCAKIIINNKRSYYLIDNYYSDEIRYLYIGNLAKNIDYYNFIFNINEKLIVINIDFLLGKPSYAFFFIPHITEYDNYLLDCTIYATNIRTFYKKTYKYFSSFFTYKEFINNITELVNIVQSQILLIELI